MIDRYNVEKIIEAQRIEAIEAAAKDRLSARCAASWAKRTERWPLAATLQRLALAALRPMAAVTIVLVETDAGPTARAKDVVPLDDQGVGNVANGRTSE